MKTVQTSVHFHSRSNRTAVMKLAGAFIGLNLWLGLIVLTLFGAAAITNTHGAQPNLPGALNSQAITTPASVAIVARDDWYRATVRAAPWPR
jgi:hypothetical protein